MKKYNPSWQEISDHLDKFLIIWGSNSGKANAFPNRTNQEVDIDKSYLYSKY